MSAGRVLHVLALLTPPIVISVLLLALTEGGLRWQRFGSAGLLSPWLHMAPSWRDADCFKTGPNRELMTPNCRMPYKGVWIETNAAGLNDREVDETQPHFRIAMLGDSVTMAAGVASRDIYHAQLEERLSADLGTPGFVELYNHGRGGRSTVDQVADFASALERWPLDAALVAVTPGNIWANLLNPKSCVAGAPDAALSDSEAGFYDQRVKGTNLASRIFHVLERETGLWTFNPPRDFFRSLTQRLMSSPEDGERIAQLEARAVDKFRDCARRMRSVANAASVDLGWIVLWYRPDRHGERVRHELKELGEPVTTTMGVHERFASTDEMIIYPTEVHPNAAVNTSFVDVLHPWLREIGWLTKIETAHRQRLAAPAAGLGR